MDLSKITVQPLTSSEDALFQETLICHHYLGSLPKIGKRRLVFYCCCLKALLIYDATKTHFIRQRIGSILSTVKAINESGPAIVIQKSPRNMSLFCLYSAMQENN